MNNKWTNVFYQLFQIIFVFFWTGVRSIKFSPKCKK